MQEDCIRKYHKPAIKDTVNKCKVVLTMKSVPVKPPVLPETVQLIRETISKASISRLSWELVITRITVWKTPRYQLKKQA